jgi:hypothetical protein
MPEAKPLAYRLPIKRRSTLRRNVVVKKYLIGLALVTMSFMVLSCQSAQDANVNANTDTATVAGPDNSEITTTTDNTGTRTETRVFRDNPRVSRVVVTTRNGQRTVKVYSKTGEEREVRDEVGDALTATGEKIATAAGFVADKTETAIDKTKEGAKTVANETADKVEDVAQETKRGAKTVANKTVDTSKTIANKTAAGAKKTGKTIKKIVTP